VGDAAALRGKRASIHIRSFVSPEALLHELQSADVFVFPSLAEGFGHVLLEAMACGLPVISTTHTAAPDLISDGREGFIIEPGDTAELVKCLEYFLKNREQLRQMGAAARARAEAFTWRRFRQRVVEAVREMIRES
jgi:glycosyltransferase involved in cell wall biosynthesis